MKVPSTQQLITRVASRIERGPKRQSLNNKSTRQFFVRTLDSIEKDIERLRYTIEDRSIYHQSPLNWNWGKINPQQFGILQTIMPKPIHEVANQFHGTRMKQILYGQNPQATPQKSPMKFDYDRLYAKSQARYRPNPENNRNRSESKIGNLIQKDKYTKSYNNKQFNVVTY